MGIVNFVDTESQTWLVELFGSGIDEGTWTVIDLLRYICLDEQTELYSTILYHVVRQPRIAASTAQASKTESIASRPKTSDSPGTPSESIDEEDTEEWEGCTGGDEMQERTEETGPSTERANY